MDINGSVICFMLKLFITPVIKRYVIVVVLIGRITNCARPSRNSKIERHKIGIIYVNVPAEQ